MKYLLITILTTISFSCKSQTISLEEEAQCLENLCPKHMYAKDINNSLNKYTGTWKGESDGKKYELKFNKNLYENSIGYKKDRIKGRLKISSLDGLTIFFNNFNETDENTGFSGLGFQPDLLSYMMVFSGPRPAGCLNFGKVFLTIKPATPNQMSIMYWSDKDIVVGECPSSFSQTFPEKAIIHLTKQ